MPVFIPIFVSVPTPVDGDVFPHTVLPAIHSSVPLFWKFPQTVTLIYLKCAEFLHQHGSNQKIFCENLLTVHILKRLTSTTVCPYLYP